MAKTKAQRQKKYRERQKTKDPKFLKRERQRVKQYCVPTSGLKIHELQERRRVTKKKVTKHREWLKQKQASVQIQPQDPNKKNTTQNVSKLIVSTDLFTPKKKSRKTPRKGSDNNSSTKQNKKTERKEDLY